MTDELNMFVGANPSIYPVVNNPSLLNGLVFNDGINGNLLIRTPLIENNIDIIDVIGIYYPNSKDSHVVVTKGYIFLYKDDKLASRQPINAKVDRVRFSENQKGEVVITTGSEAYVYRPSTNDIKTLSQTISLD